jgi:peptidoglycan hydrolase-like protein with peptidoglycan-binding domain
LKKRTFVALWIAAGLLAPVSTVSMVSVNAYAATYPTISVGSRGSTVSYLQEKLNSLGYNCGKVDGIFGSKTLTAVEKFQKAKHLAVDGIVGPKTWAALNSATSSGSSQSSSHSSSTSNSTPKYPGHYIQMGATGNNVKTVQTQLNKLGYSCGQVDGVFGTKTYNAVKSFQKANKLSVDGIVGPSTWNKLFSSTAVKASQTSSSSKSSSSSSSGSSKTGDSTGSNQSSGSGTSSGSSGSGSGGSTNQSTKAPSFPGTVLKIGSTGTAVKEVQQRLNDLGYPCGTVDGEFGAKTESAVKAFQKAKNLTVDGEVGPETWAVLFNVKVTTADSFTNVDLRYPAPKSVTASQIDSWIAANHPGDMEGLGQYFINAQNTYGTNATYLLAHAALETGWGTSSLALNKNNWFGYGAYDRDAYGYGGTFPSSEYAIMFEAWEVRQNYLTPGASNYHSSPTLNGMNANYATSSTWADSIGEIMSEYVSQTGGSDSDYVQYQPSNNPPAPASSTEPVYKVSTDATAEVASKSPYSSLPVFASLSADAENYFLYGTLSQTTSSVSFPAVKKLQQALNQDPAVKSKLTVDGVFGPATTQALKQYQSAHGLTPTGVCDDATWAKLFPATGTSLKKGKTYHIDEMEQFLTTGMSGGSKYFVTLWYHVVGYGWVPSTEVQLDNMYRVIPSTGYTVTLTGTGGSITLHRGDFAVENTNGQLEVYNQQTGKLIIGKPSRSVSLQKFTLPVVHGS